MTAASARPRRIPPDGPPLRIDDDQPTFWDRVEAGTWEPGTLAVLRRLAGPGTTFLDLGAWVGALSLHAASRGARVVSVEADPAALDQLRRNLAANPGLAERVAVVPKAVSAQPGRVRLGARRKPGDSMSSTLLAGAATSWTAEAVTPAELAALARTNGTLVVKLDIEGGEYDLLPAFAPVLSLARNVLVSFHPAILRASGEPDVEGRMAAALAAFAGWRAAPVGASGAGETGPLPSDPADVMRHDTWLFSASG